MNSLTIGRVLAQNHHAVANRCIRGAVRFLEPGVKAPCPRQIDSVSAPAGHVDAGHGTGAPAGAHAADAAALAKLPPCCISTGRNLPPSIMWWKHHHHPHWEHLQDPMILWQYGGDTNFHATA